jgi:HEAT repeat protein
MDEKIRQHISTFLTADDPDARRIAAENLTEAKDFSVIAALLAGIDDENKGVRDAAARLLVDIGGRDVARAIACLIVDDNIAKRNLASKVLVSIGEPAVRFVLPYLRDFNKDIRKFAVDILGSIKSEDSLFHLLPLLEDSDPNVRISTIEALGNIGSKEATLPLCSAIVCDPTVLGCAADALGKIGDKSALCFLVDSLSECMRLPDDNPLALSAIIESLGRIGDLETLGELQRYLNSLQGELRLILLQAMLQIAERFGEPIFFNNSVCEDLLNGLSSDDVNLRLSCAKGLHSFHSREVTRAIINSLGIEESLDKVLTDLLSDRPEAFEACVECLEGPSGRNLEQLIRLLGQSAWKSVTLFSHDAISHLSEDLVVRAFEAVRKQWKTSNGETREAILDTLFMLDGQRAIPVFSEFIADSDSWLRVHMIDQLGKMKNRRALHCVRELLNDEDDEVRAAAIITLNSAECEWTGILP